jgi:electron-transferring-flavoprotein dehydrogenase
MSIDLEACADPELDAIERDSVAVDIACVGFGPAMGGFLTTLTRALSDGSVQSAAPGLPPQIMCYERAEDLGFGVSGVVTRARGIRASFPDLDPTQIPMAVRVSSEKMLYLLDPIGASRRSAALRIADAAIRAFHFALPVSHHAVELPYMPDFLRKHDGFVLSVGQFNQWVGSQLAATGMVQIWPGMPVAQALVEGDRVTGIRLVDQGTDKSGNPESAFMPGMDVRADLTVVADGPVGPVGRQLDREFGMPDGHHRREWALGMKFVVELREGVDLEPGTVFHTFGFPEPEIFGFFYVHPERLVSAGIFVPSWFGSPVRTAYRYLQHFVMHPYLWRYLQGGTLRSWGAKSLQESGKRGEPLLAGNGYARIGEDSGSTNVLTGSGVDEAWTTGTLLAEGVIELLRAGEPFTRENLERAYVARRRASWVEQEGRIAEKSRDGFQRGAVTGVLGMALAGLTQGRLSLGHGPRSVNDRVSTVEHYFGGRIPLVEIEQIRRGCAESNTSLHDALMDRCGWPLIPLDGQLLISHQDALLLGGKVMAPAGYADHVVFHFPEVCQACDAKLCIEMCSGQAIAPGDGGLPVFDREKCVHCGACLWNCVQTLNGEESANIEFRAGAGGLHSALN